MLLSVRLSILIKLDSKRCFIRTQFMCYARWKSSIELLLINKHTMYTALFTFPIRTKHFDPYVRTVTRTLSSEYTDPFTTRSAFVDSDFKIIFEYISEECIRTKNMFFIRILNALQQNNSPRLNAIVPELFIKSNIYKIIYNPNIIHIKIILG